MGPAQRSCIYEATNGQKLYVGDAGSTVLRQVNPQIIVADEHLYTLPGTVFGMAISGNRLYLAVKTDLPSESLLIYDINPINGNLTLSKTVVVSGPGSPLWAGGLQHSRSFLYLSRLISLGADYVLKYSIDGDLISTVTLPVSAAVNDYKRIYVLP